MGIYYKSKKLKSKQKKVNFHKNFLNKNKKDIESNFKGNLSNILQIF